MCERVFSAREARGERFLGFYPKCLRLYFRDQCIKFQNCLLNSLLLSIQAGREKQLEFARTQDSFT